MFKFVTAALSIFILFAAFGQTAAQHSRQLPFANMKKNGLTVAPVAIFSDQKEIQLGYERMLGPRVSLGLRGGFNYGNDAPQRTPYFTSELSGTSFHHCYKEVTWFFIIPIGYESNCLSPKKATSSTIEEFHQQSNAFGGIDLKVIAVPFTKSKVPNGLYLAPGFTAGRRQAVQYTRTQTTRQEIETVAAESNMWGLPFILVGTSTDYVQKIDNYRSESLEREDIAFAYLEPRLTVGAMLPLTNTLGIDLSGFLAIEKNMDGEGSRGRVHLNFKAGLWF